MNQKKSSNGFLILVVLLAIGIYYFSSTFNTGSENYSYQKFLSDVKAEKVIGVTFEQNKEVPTGKLTAEYAKDTYRSCEITNVEETMKEVSKDFTKTENNLKTN